MAFDQALAARLADALQQVAPDRITEKRMFGGLCFML
jgi:hypothetical protein